MISKPVPVSLFVAKSYYRPLTKLKEGNFFIHVSLSFCSQWVLVQGPGPTPSVQGPSSSQSHYLSFRILASAFLQGPDPFPFLQAASVQDLTFCTGPGPRPSSCQDRALSATLQTCSNLFKLDHTVQADPKHVQTCSAWTWSLTVQGHPQLFPLDIFNLFTMKQRLSASRWLAFH